LTWRAFRRLQADFGLWSVKKTPQDGAHNPIFVKFYQFFCGEKSNKYWG
jgi:hypothetical protein